MPGSGPLDADVILSGDETEALLALLSDVAQGHGDAPRIRDAASAAWALLSNRAATQGGYAPARDDSYYRLLLERMQNRDKSQRAQE